MSKNTGKQRYGYCIELERALEEFYGLKSRWYGTADSYWDPKEVRKALRSAVTRIRSRLKDILTVDERLLLTTSITLTAITREAGQLGKSEVAEVRVIAHLLHLVAHLLGFDWLQGKPNREVVYYQTAAQQRLDDRMQHPISPLEDVDLLWDKRRKIAKQLCDQSLRVSQISQVMNLSRSVVKDLLVREGSIHRDGNNSNS